MFLMIILSFQFSHPRYLNYIFSFLYQWNKVYLCGILLFIPYLIWVFRTGDTMVAQTRFEALHAYIGGGLIFLIIFRISSLINRESVFISVPLYLLSVPEFLLAVVLFFYI